MKKLSNILKLFCTTVFKVIYFFKCKGRTLIVLVILLINSAIAVDKIPFIDLDEETHSERRRILQETVFSPQEIVLPLYQMVKDAQDLFNKYEVYSCLAYGNFLGIGRAKKGEGGLLLQDDDADFLVDKNSLTEKKIKCLQEEFSLLGYNFFEDDLVGWKIYKKEPVYCKKLDQSTYIFTDIFLCELNQDKSQYILSMPKGRERFTKASINKESFENREIYNFGEVKVYGPSNPDMVLSYWYGKEWNTLALYYWAHYYGEKGPKQKYKWHLDEEDRRAAQPTGPLIQNVKIS